MTALIFPGSPSRQRGAEPKQDGHAGVQRPRQSVHLLLRLVPFIQLSEQHPSSLGQRAGSDHAGRSRHHCAQCDPL